MAKKSPTKKTPKNLRAEAKILRSKGIIPKWDLRVPLSDYKKRVLRKAAKEWGHVLRRPKDFDFRKVSEKTGGKLREAGFQLFKDRAVIPTRGQKVNIKRGTVYIRKSGRIEKVILAAGPDIIRRIDARIEAGKDSPALNTFFGLKLGQDFFNASANTFYTSLSDLREAMLSPNYANKPSLLNNLAIVEVSFFDDEDDPESWERNI